MFFQTTGLFVFGLFVGTFGTMLGIGGGWLHVPFLIILYNFSPQVAIGTSIGIIFVNTLCGSIVYYSQRRLDLNLAKNLSYAVIPGALIGPFIVQHYTNEFFDVIFSLLLVFIAWVLFNDDKYINIIPESRFTDKTIIKDKFGQKISYSTNIELGATGSFIIGFISNLFGIGGGILHIPFLILFLRVPTHIALGTSHLVLCVSSFFGTIVYACMGEVEINFMMPIALGTIIGARYGAELARVTKAGDIRKIIAAVLLFVAIRMFALAF